MKKILLLFFSTICWAVPPEFKYEPTQERMRQRAYKALFERRPHRVIHFYYKIEDQRTRGELLADIFDQLRPGDCTHKDLAELRAIVVEFEGTNGHTPKMLDYWYRALDLPPVTQRGRPTQRVSR